MTNTIVVIGGSAAGMGAAGAAKQVDPNARVVVFTELQDVAYSPCGIPYVHGKEIDDFQRLFLATKEAYVEAGIDIRYETRVRGSRSTTRRSSARSTSTIAPWRCPGSLPCTSIAW